MEYSNERPNLLKRSDAAVYLGISPNTLRAWASRGTYKIPYRKVGREVEYLVEDLEKFIESRRRTKG